MFFKKNKFKLISIIVTTDLLLSFSGSVADLKFALGFSLFYGVLIGLIVGSILDRKSNKKRELREFNKNIKIYNENKASMNTTTNTSNDLIGKIERLNKLKSENAITEEEYIKLKNELLNKDVNKW